jgi:hypothetical protein
MNEPAILKGMDRRRFLTRLAPACALTCFGAKLAFASRVLSGQEATQSSTHKFDKPYDRPFTVRQLTELQYRNYIQLAKALEKSLGKEESTRLLEEVTKEMASNIGKAFAQRQGSNSFATFVGTFKNPAFAGNLVLEIIEDTDRAFEIKVTECLIAETFKRAGVLEMGNAAVCIGDFAMAEAFNPGMKLIRDKTLTLGFPYCNHRYVLLD